MCRVNIDSIIITPKRLLPFCSLGEEGELGREGFGTSRAEAGAAAMQTGGG